MFFIPLIISSIKIFFFITPLFCLIASSFFLNVESTLSFSLVLLICQLISLIIQSFFIKSGLENWNLLKFLLDIPILGLSFFIYPYIPTTAIDIYYFCFKYIFPLLVFSTEAYQGVLLVVFKTRSIKNNIAYGSSTDYIFKSSLLIISFISYITSIYLIYEIFSYNEISTLNACLLSSLGTLMILLIPYMTVVEESIISDISLITLIICLNLYSYFFQFNTQTLICSVNIFKSLSYLITLFLISYPLINRDSDDNVDEDSDSIIYKLKNKFISIGLVIGLTYLPLSMVGVISNSNLLFRYIQGVVTVLLYFGLLSNKSLDDYDGSFKFKYD
ncbi:hypothetical protein DICPUDRAFT_75179 [Dictyostelium purpureum]|uniref:Uncharacterized protein n=1 Tax=Dictyostelium purpureum TaxID=5786 RepID=F0Z9W8_DICPU|nr:uncharacterized protein DICPUDRAFT_75179 [Dictyostelium purpureum]EGC39311.1 hypothetical protein DICPUDRAFT_75179 [Dictyostelium purpureum]|eukprot:XP_003284215.1 hypothetical protein DICPUDRAFT_75179 [Dictyostelium purpureum]